MIPLPDAPPTLVERVWITERCTHDDGFRQQVLEKCRTDTAWFISCFGWTFNPKVKDPRDRLIPFVLPGRFEYQIDFISWLDDLYENGGVGTLDKSREMGASWIVIAWTLHKWLFEEGFQALFGTRKEDLVDNRMPSSSFGKLDILIRELPGWMVPRGYNPEKHRMKMKLINPANGAVIEGDSTNPDFSRQGRYSFIFLDEAASVPDLDLVMEAMSASSDCKLLVSTPKGMNGFARIRFSGKVRHYTMHYSLDPEKDEAWVEQMRRELITDEAMAQELEINYKKSAEGVVYPTFIHVPVGYYPFDPETHVLYCTWDFGINDPTGIIWWGRNLKTGKSRMVDSFKKKGVPVDFYVPFALGYIPPELRGKYEYTASELAIIARHAAWGPATHYGDPAGRQRAQSTGQSVNDVLAGYGIHIQSNTKLNDHASRKRVTELGLRDLEGIHEESCYEVVEAMLNATYAVKSPDSRSTREVNAPIHDWTSHWRSAVEYYFVNLPPAYKRSRPDPTVARFAYTTI